MARPAAIVSCPAPLLDWDGLDDGKFAPESEPGKGANKAAGLSPKRVRGCLQRRSIWSSARGTSTRQTG